jgi:hypothetical protein
VVCIWMDIVPALMFWSWRMRSSFASYRIKKTYQTVEALILDVLWSGLRALCAFLLFIAAYQTKALALPWASRWVERLQNFPMDKVFPAVMYKATSNEDWNEDFYDKLILMKAVLGSGIQIVTQSMNAVLLRKDSDALFIASVGTSGYLVFRTIANYTLKHGHFCDRADQEARPTAASSGNHPSGEQLAHHDAESVEIAWSARALPTGASSGFESSPHDDSRTVDQPQ